jgi:hypothetical protein
MIPDMVSTSESPATVLLRMMRGYWVSQTIFTAARLNIADLLRDGPQTCAALSDRTSVPERSLYRLLRALASVGVFVEVEERTFALTPLAELLRSDVPGSLRASGVFMGEVLYRVWNELLPGLQSGEAQFGRVFGAEFWEYLAAHPELAVSFQDMMADLNALTNAAVPAAYDFSGVDCIVDVAGGNGSQLAAILQANPRLRGVLFDLPYALDEARRQLTATGVIDRCEVVAGDFLERVPEGGDVYLLRWVLHDYDDERNIRILRNCRAAMPDHGRLLVVELVIGSGSDPDGWTPRFLDLQMLLNFGGQERTEAEFRSLFSAAAFQLQRLIPTRSPMSILEAVPC